MKKIFYYTLVLFLICACTQKTETQKATPLRKDIPEKYKWNLSSLCSDSVSWAKDYKRIENEINKFAKNKLTIESSQGLYDILYKQDSIYNELLRLYLYAMLQEDVDLYNETSKSMRIQMDILESNYYDAFSIVEPTVLKIKKTTIKKWISNYPKLKEYNFYLKDLYYSKKHTPTKEQNKILNNYSLATESVSGVYDELFYSDLNEPEYDNYSTDRKKRLKEYSEYTNFYTSKRNTVAELIVSDIQLKYAKAKSIGYKSILQEDLNNDSVPVQIYKGLSSAMKKGSIALQKYHKIRAELLKISDYQPADKDFCMYTTENQYNYDTAKIIIKNTLKPLGLQYQNCLDSMFDEHKIDVFDNEGKISTAAYTASVFRKIPYILTTYDNKLEDVFTLIHELGHAVHAMYSMKNQALSNYSSPELKDEITSTFNEVLLTDYLLKNTKDERQRLYVLESAISNMEYYYFQSLESDFTFNVCSAIETDQAVTASDLDSMYVKLYHSYYGNTINNLEPSNWTKYGMLDYYCYKYVFSMSAALNFYESIKTGNKSKIMQYLDFLKMGGNDYTLAQLEKVGINMNNKEALNAIGNYTSQLVDLYAKELTKYKENK